MELGASQVRSWPLWIAGACAVALAATGVLPFNGSLVHAVALPPFDLTFDMGILLSRATNPLWFALGLALALGTRSILLSLMLGSTRHVWFMLRFEILCLVPAFIGAELVYSGAAILYAALLWVGAGVTVFFALFLAHVPWSGSTSVLAALAKGLLRGPRIPTIVIYLLALLVIGALPHYTGRPGAVVCTALSILITVATARRLRSRASAPAGTLVATTIVVVLAVALTTLPSASATSTAAPPAEHGTLFLVAGIDTSSGHGTLFSLRPSSLGFTCGRTEYFSYAGQGDGTARGQAVCPIRSGARYGRTDTERSLSVLARDFTEEVDRLAPPVTVVAHSSGAWIAWDALANARTTSVEHLIMLAPLTDPAGYTSPGKNGSAVVGAAGMRLVAALGRHIGFTRFNPDLPLPSELLAKKDAVSRLLSKPLRRVRALAVTSAYDVALFAGAGDNPFPEATVSCPLLSTHSSLVLSAAAAEDAVRFIHRRPQGSCAPWGQWVAAAGASFSSS